MFYSVGSEAGLTIPPEVTQNLSERIHQCVVCTQEPAPPGIEQRRSLYEWAKKRLTLATMTDEEDARRRQALHQPDVCAACMSQLRAVIGVPTNVLVPLVKRLREDARTDLIRLLETHFVFVICKGCASQAAELERISAAEIEGRYERMLTFLYGTTRHRAAASRPINELLAALTEAIRARDAA